MTLRQTSELPDGPVRAGNPHDGEMMLSEFDAPRVWLPDGAHSLVPPGIVLLVALLALT